MRARRDEGADGWVIQHIQAPDRAAELVERGRELFGCEPQWVSEVGPVIGTYTGPGLLGVGGVPARLLRQRSGGDGGARAPRAHRRAGSRRSPSRAAPAGGGR